jgi:hypothetical protein
MALGGHRKEERMWQETLGNLAASFGVSTVPVESTVVCVDRKRQWRNARNLRHNAAIRSTLYSLRAPFRHTGRRFGRRPEDRDTERTD